METRKIYLEEVPWEEARERYFEILKVKGALTPGPPEEVPVPAARGRVTAEPVFAALSVPHYHAAAMDGVAVRAQATFGASETSPRRLKLGEEAIEVDTGDPLPEGCDAVIMVEDLHFLKEGAVEIIAPAVPWQNVRPLGEDVVASELLFPARYYLRPYDLAALLTSGISKVSVYPRPRLALLPTGTEVVPPGSNLLPGNVIESNSYLLGALLEEIGGMPVFREIVPDDYARLKEALLQALEVAEGVAVIAGSSAGREDFTAKVIAELGEVYVHGVATKPGKPVVLGYVREKPVFGVPGYPVSAALAFELFVAPFIYARQGLLPPSRSKIRAYLPRKVSSAGGVEEFLRVKLGPVGQKTIALPLARGAGIITSLARADGFLRVPRFCEGYPAGAEVEVELLRPAAEIKKTIVVTGSHDLALDLLDNYLRSLFPGWRLASTHVGSLRGLQAVKQEEAHLAGTHLLDPATGEYNLSYVREIFAPGEACLINLAYRTQGLILPSGNPKNIKAIRDLAQKKVRFINRQRGSGTRVLFDYLLEQEGLDPCEIKGYHQEEFTHLAVAAAVASGRAEAGLGILAAAQALGLTFIPVGEERYDLCVLKKYLDSLPLRLFLKALNLPAFRAAVEACGGYSLRSCGQVILV